MTTHPRLLRKPETLARLGISKTHLHNQLASGLLPPQIPLGARSIGFLEHEITAIINARALGKCDDELRAVVKQLVESRKGVEL